MTFPNLICFLFHLSCQETHSEIQCLIMEISSSWVLLIYTILFSFKSMFCLCTQNCCFILCLYYATISTKSLQSCPTVCGPRNYSFPGSSVHEILQARILEWVAIFGSRESSRPRGLTHISCVSCIGRQILYHCATWEAPLWKYQMLQNYIL